MKAPTIVARAFDHVSFVVADVEAALDFYVGVIGCELVDRPDLGFPGAWLQVGLVQIHLVTPIAGVDPGRPPTAPTGNANHAAFTIDNHGAALEALRSVGVDVREGTVGIRQLFVQDPDGNVIEPVERTPR